MFASDGSVVGIHKWGFREDDGEGDGLNGATPISTVIDCLKKDHEEAWHQIATRPAADAASPSDLGGSR